MMLMEVEKVVTIRILTQLNKALHISERLDGIKFELYIEYTVHFQLFCIVVTNSVKQAERVNYLFKYLPYCVVPTVFKNFDKLE